MTPLVLDIECTFHNKGNPFDQRNKCVVVGVNYVGDPIEEHDLFYEEHFRDPSYLEKMYITARETSHLVGFNIKFDLHWLRKIGVDISGIRVWDCQLAEFILENQKTPYPSLNDVAAKYGLGQKLDVIEKEYWSKGINTDEIPRDILSEYLSQDLNLTEQVYLKQKEQFEKNPQMYALFRLQCADLLVLEEMEWNGLQFDTKAALSKAEEIRIEIAEVKKGMSEFLGNIPFNPDSNDHLSAALYGGEIVEEVRVPIGVYKTGAKIGQTRYKVLEKVYKVDRKVEPIKGTETKKHTEERPFWKVNEPILRKLKADKHGRRFIDLILRYNRLEKLDGTYLSGLSNLIENMHWEPDTLHGTFNQCVAVTGRLSSSKPNQQNLDPITKQFIITRYKDEQ